MVGMRDRATGKAIAKAVPNARADTLQGFVEQHRAPNAPLYTDGSGAYDGLSNREAVHHSVGEYVRGMVHTNGMESFWATLKRAHKGTFHRLSQSTSTGTLPSSQASTTSATSTQPTRWFTWPPPWSGTD
ncbi:MAG: transposase [bacterium]|nr:transposase [bacterium]